ncbi:MAG: aldo/keto reductase [Geminicoccaceae bacterium]|jgi:D-threo-aldose 1-dehydrogenase
MIGSRQLGRTALQLTCLGFGTGMIGRLDGSDGEDVAAATLESAWQAGIRYFDTAPLYGLGRSETRLGRFLQTKPRGAFTISTKVGRLLQRTGSGEPGFVFDYGGDAALRSLEASLHRLGLGRIDIALVHDIDRWTHGEAQPLRMGEALDGALPTLLQLRGQGVVDAVGLGVNNWQVCREVAQRADIDCFLLAGRHTLLDQEASAELLPLCGERGIGLIIGGPYNTGILATGSVAPGTYNYAPAPADVIDRVRRIESVLARHGVTLAAAALNYPLLDPAVATVIPGLASPAEVDAAVAHVARRIPREVWAELRTEGLLR